MGNRLYVGNLPFDATEKQIQKAFESAARKVTSIKIVADRETGKSRGFAFMDLENAEHYGVSKIEQFSWKDKLDFYACTACGRCQDRCPASMTGKPLSRSSFGLFVPGIPNWMP